MGKFKAFHADIEKGHVSGARNACIPTLSIKIQKKIVDTLKLDIWRIVNQRTGYEGVGWERDKESLETGNRGGHYQP